MLKVSNLFYYFREAFTSLSRNCWLSLASVGVIIISLFILGSSVLLVMNVRHLANRVESSVEISVFIQDGVNKEDIKELGKQIEALDGVESVQFVSRWQALEELKESLDDKAGALQGLEENNTLPDSYRVKAVNTPAVPEIAQDIKYMYGVEKVRYGQGVVEKLVTITRWVRTAGIALMVLMGLAAVFLIATTIRMSIFSRRSEIEIMKYLGATNFFIRMPFMLEGLVLGMSGGLVTAGVLYYGYYTLVSRVNNTLAFMQLVNQQELIAYTLGGLVLLGILLGVLGSGISVRRFLKV